MRDRRSGVRKELAGNFGEADAILVTESDFGDSLTVYVRSIGGIEVFEQKIAVLAGDFRMHQRDRDIVDDNGVAFHSPNGDGLVFEDVGNRG